MKILVLGAGGMIGRKFIERVLEAGSLRGETVEAVTAFDVHAPDFAHERVAIDNVGGDVADFGMCRDLVAERPDVIVHLAAVVSGQAEEDFELGYRVNLDGTRTLFEAIRLEGGAAYAPRVVYASSIAVFGAPFPDTIPDEFHLTPLTSYGVQKAIGELLLMDYTRRGFMDGVGLRFPTIVVRPGKPNLAASGFFSNIVREPLAGQEAVLPVDRDVMHWMASPRAAAGFCLHAAEMDTETIGPRRNLTMPGVAVTVGEEIEAVRRAGGDEAAALIREEPDEAIRAMVGNWPRRFDARRATELGFEAEGSFDDIVKAHVEDEASA